MQSYRYTYCYSLLLLLFLEGKSQLLRGSQGSSVGDNCVLLQ